MSTRRSVSKRARPKKRSPATKTVRRRTPPAVSIRREPPSDAASGLAPGMHPINTYLAVANVGATMDFLERAFGLRRGRYFGFAKTRLQHLMTGAAINLARLDDWIAGVARETTRLTPFQQLMKIPAPS